MENSESSSRDKNPPRNSANSQSPALLGQVWPGHATTTLLPSMSRTQQEPVQESQLIHDNRRKDSYFSFYSIGVSGMDSTVTTAAVQDYQDYQLFDDNPSYFSMAFSRFHADGHGGASSGSCPRRTQPPPPEYQRLDGSGNDSSFSLNRNSIGLGLKRLQEVISCQGTSAVKEILKLMLDEQGCREVASLIPRLEKHQLRIIAEQLSQHWLELATHPIGCYSLNNFVNHVEAPLRLELLNKIADKSVFLAQHPTGNHALQHILQLQDLVIVQKICWNLRGVYQLLALQKKGSYVVQKCLDSSCWVHAMEDLLQLNEAQLVRLAKDQFGNYVVRKALQVSHSKSTRHYLDLAERLNNNLSHLRYGYGNRVRLEMLNLEDPTTTTRTTL